MNQTRLNKLQTEIQKQEINGVILMPGPNSVYFSGMATHVSERPILLFIPNHGEPAIIIPTLEAMKARDAGIPADRLFTWTDESGYVGAFRQAAEQLYLDESCWGVEALHMRVLELEALKSAAPSLATTHAGPLMDILRLVKDKDEIAALEKAIAIAESSMDALLPKINVGMTEKQVAALLTQELLLGGGDAIGGGDALGGGDAIAFGPIVSSGPNSASPHAMPTKRPLQTGDLLVIDWGVFVDNYPSDITRTFAVGEVDPELREIYAIVKAANAAGKAASRPGATCQDVDRAARAVITKAGYGDYFFHRTGHGLGLMVHEEPSIVEGNTSVLAEGNVFTVEPGIYLPGRGGVRIEDDVLITTDGHRVLTSYPRDLITVG